MEKYNSKNALYPETDNVWYPNPDAPELVGRVEHPHIIFNNEDGKCGMKVSLEEIVDVWLETLEPELQQTLELEEKTRSEIKELETLQREKEKREEREKNQKNHQVYNMLKPFLREQIVKVLNEKGLKINKSNIRSIIRECRIKIGYRTGFYCYSPMGILFTEKEWDEFREECNKIHKDPIGGRYDDYGDAVKYGITTDLTELRDAPISDWK